MLCPPAGHQSWHAEAISRQGVAHEQVQAELDKMQQLEQSLNERFQPQLQRLHDQSSQLSDLRQAQAEAESSCSSLRRCVANLAQVRISLSRLEGVEV